MTIFGEFSDGGELEAAAEATLRHWFNTYLREIERKRGLAQLTLEPPRSYVVAVDDDPAARWPEQQLPCVWITSPGIVDPPAKDGSGRYRARFLLSVTVVVKGPDATTTRKLSRYYGAAARLILIQQAGLKGVGTVNYAVGLSWTGEAYDRIPTRAARSLAAVSCGFEVDVADVADHSQGPLVPDPDPDPVGTTWPTVLTTPTEIDREAVDE